MDCCRVRASTFRVLWRSRRRVSYCYSPPSRKRGRLSWELTGVARLSMLLPRQEFPGERSDATKLTLPIAGCLLRFAVSMARVSLCFLNTVSVRANAEGQAIAQGGHSPDERTSSEIVFPTVFRWSRHASRFELTYPPPTQPNRPKEAGGKRSYRTGVVRRKGMTNSFSSSSAQWSGLIPHVVWKRRKMDRTPVRSPGHLR